MNVFVFGSNLAGRHGKGAAKWALQHRGARYGQGLGLQGMSYAIPTKDSCLKVLSLCTIRFFVQQFLKFAAEHPTIWFQVTAIGTGLAGYKAEQIAPMFATATDNVLIPQHWSKLLPEHRTWAGETTEQYDGIAEQSPSVV